MSIRPIAGIAMVLLLAACGSATDATTFQAPPNFAQVAQVGPLVEIWQTSDKKNTLVLTALPAKIKLEDALSESDVHDSDVKASKKIAICGTQPAYFYDVIGTVNTKATVEQKPNQRIEVVATLLNGKTYFAIYTRPLDASADSAAEAAIKNVCPKVSS